MRVVLINPPQDTRYPQPPMGLALLGAILEREGYRVNIEDMNVYHNSWKFALLADVVGITAMTPTIVKAMGIVQELKVYRPEMPIILGGVHATVLPFETKAENTIVDTLVVGEGENAILDVLGNGIRGIYQSENRVDLESLPYLHSVALPWYAYKPHPPHGQKLPWFPLITSRGCPYRCAFCAGSVFGKKFRGQSPKRVVDEMEYLQKWFGVKEIAFYDDVFTMDKERVAGICEEILKRDLKVLWTCETRVDLVSKELLSLMKRAGCYSISYGIESGSEELLEVLCKGVSLDQVVKTVAWTRQAGIESVGYFMIGSPGETTETIRRTIDFAKMLKLDFVQFSVTTPFPNTKLYDMYGKENIPWDSYVYAGLGAKTSPVFESNVLSRGDIEAWISRAYKEFYLRPSYVWQRLTKMQSLGDVRVTANGLKMLRGM